MKNFNGSWKHKPPIFYVIVLVAIGAAILAIWRQYHPYDYIVWDALIVVFAVAVIVTCLYYSGSIKRDKKRGGCKIQ